MKEKGQALVEFILILPIILLVFVALLDIGNIFLQKYKLNDSLQTVTDLYQNDKQVELKAYIAKEGLTFEETKTGDMAKLTLKKQLTISAPGLTNVLGKKHTIGADKNIYLNSMDFSEETNPPETGETNE